MQYAKSGFRSDLAYHKITTYKVYTYIITACRLLFCYCKDILKTYKGNSKSKVPYFIPSERIPAMIWQKWVQLAHILTTSGKTRTFNQRSRSSSFAWQCLTSQCCRNRDSLELLGLGNSSTSTIQSWFGTVGLPSRIPKDEKAPQEVSASTPMKMFKMKSRNLSNNSNIFNWMILMTSQQISNSWTECYYLFRSLFTDPIENCSGAREARCFCECLVRSLAPFQRE
jgi:hypothetical protein